MSDLGRYRRFVRTDRRLDDLRPVLWQWIALLERMTLEWTRPRLREERDYPWWYHERPDVGLLAGAAFLAGGIAFEEYACAKRGEKEDEPIRGRNDLYLALGKREWTIEAKRKWVDISEGSKAAKQSVERALEEAEADLSKIEEEDHYGEPLAAVFLLPALDKEAEMDLDIATNWLDGWMRQGDPDTAVATYFPEDGMDAQEEDYVYPGLALILRRTSWKK